MTNCKEMVTVVVAAIMDCNILVTSTSKGAELSSSKRRNTFIEHNYPYVMPVEYQLEQPVHSSMYVPILSMIQQLFKNPDILIKITETNTTYGQYVSCSNGSHSWLDWDKKSALDTSSRPAHYA